MSDVNIGRNKKSASLSPPCYMGGIPSFVSNCTEKNQNESSLYFILVFITLKLLSLLNYLRHKMRAP